MSQNQPNNLNLQNEPPTTVERLTADPNLEEFPTTFTSSPSKYNPNKVDYRIAVEGGYLDGSANPGEKQVYINQIKVDEEYEGQGRGTYLLRAFAREMVNRGMQRLESDVVNPRAMRNRERVFGPGKTEIYEGGRAALISKAPEYVDRPLPIDPIQAVQSLVRSETRAQRRKELEIKHTSQDTQGWESSVDLTDPEVVALLNHPSTWKKTVQSANPNEEHFPTDWDVVISPQKAIAGSDKVRELPKTRRFGLLTAKFQEKARTVGRRAAVIIGVGAAALALFSGSTTESDGVPTVQQATSDYMTEVPVGNDQPRLERSSTPASVTESVTVGAYDSQTGKGTLHYLAEQRITQQTGHQAQPQAVHDYINVIQRANGIAVPSNIQPQDTIILPPLDTPQN